MGLPREPTATETVDGHARQTFSQGGRVMIESWEIAGAGHATFVDPDTGCGAVAAYVSDEDICAVRHMAAFFGLSGAPPIPPPVGDGGPATLPDGGPAPADAGSSGGRDGGSDGIACGAMVCDPATQQCCRTRGGGGFMEACIARDAMCDGIPAGCDGPEDCAAGEVCCLRAGGGGGSASCTAEGSCDGRRACNVMADCPSGQMCCDASAIGFAGGICNVRCFP